MIERAAIGSRHRLARHRAGRGFTLIELAVVIAIVGLLLGAILTPLATQLEVRKNKETERLLREIKSALTGFAIVNGKLPCPDAVDDVDEQDGVVVDGTEDCDSVGRGVLHGYLPWVDLGVQPTDSWGNLFAYRVTAEFTYAAQAGAAAPVANQLDLDDDGDITIQTRRDDAATPATVEKNLTALATAAPVVVISYGANGWGGRTVDGDTRAAPGAGTDEAENVSTNDNAFVFRLHTPGGDDCDDADPADVYCEFDDHVIWLSRPALAGELVNAGRLP